MFRRPQRTELVTGLDIGSHAIRLAAGQITFDARGKANVQIIGAVEVPSEGIHKGNVTSIEETVSSIAHGLEQLERLIGVPVDRSWVGVSGANIQSQEGKGVIAVAKADGEISEEDVARVIEGARMVASPLNYEVLHVIPKRFSVDGQTGIKDPVGMTGIRLEVDAQLIFGASTHLKNTTKGIYRTGIDIDDLVLSILATGDAVTTSRQKELGVAVINIGGSTTSLVVYEEGDIVHTAMIPIGSEHITNDLAIGLRTSIDVAERVKIEFGSCLPDQFKKKDMVDLFDAGAEYHEQVSLQYIAEIVHARVSEILDHVDAELERIDCSGMLPAGIILTGGGAKVHGIVELTKDHMRLPAALGYPIDIESIHEKVYDLAFSTAVGLVKWATSLHEQTSSRRRSRFAVGNSVMQKMKYFAKSLMP